jgi:uncharacterized protein (TIGR01777 family)
MSRVLVLGGSGFIGSALVPRLQRDGHHVTVLTRDAHRARQVLGGEPALVGPNQLASAVADADAVINVAGESIAGRWTRRVKRAALESRIGLTRDVVDAMARAMEPPQVLINASAIGVYGDAGDFEMDERTLPGAGPLSNLCLRWEREALNARSLGVRVVLPRLGVVLGDGGALAAMAPVFRMGMGGRLGSGRQWMSWVHIDDVVEALVFALDTPTLRGPVNVVSPEPVRQAEFAQALAQTLGRRAVLPVPKLALKIALGEAAGLVLDSQRVLPEALRRAGFLFEHSAVSDALYALLVQGTPQIRRLEEHEWPASDYCARRRPRYVLEQRQIVDHPVAQVSAFFEDPRNLGLLTPPSMDFQIETPGPYWMCEGEVIDYTIRLNGLPMRWRTVIEEWTPLHGFVDAQHRGPYASWWHEHIFVAQGDHTVLIDRVYYAPPFGLLGDLVNQLFIRSRLQQIFRYRTQVIARRFPGLVEVKVAA